MQMGAEEIAISYKQAKNKLNQIGILAELNLCTKKEIRAILREQGFDVYEPVNRYMKAKQEEAKEEKKEVLKMPKADGIIIEALKEKQKDIANNLQIIAERQDELKQQEEELTRQFAALEEYVKKIS